MVGKKKSRSWDDIGEEIGKKIGKEMERGFAKAHRKDQPFWCGPWMWHKHEAGGGFGRLLFIIGLLWGLTSVGWFPQVEIWPLILIVVGFTLMRL